MTNPEKENTPTSLIQQARNALAQGESEHAREIALRATEDPAQAEQAWLILASLSQAQQALLYIENALKVNPESQAARKAVRLVYSQMTREKKNKEMDRMDDIPPVPVSRSLEDTRPIPVVVNAQEEQPSFSIDEETPEPTAETPVEILDENAASSTTIISKEVFRSKLRGQSKPNTALQEQPVLDETSPDESGREKKTRFRRKFNPVPAAEGDKAVEPSDEETDTVEEFSSESESLQIAESDSEETEAAVNFQPDQDIQPDVQTEEYHHVEPALEVDLQGTLNETLEETPEQSQEEKPNEEDDADEGSKTSTRSTEAVIPAKNTQKASAVRLENKHQNEQTAAGRPNSRESRNGPTNVDTIELILVSIAAIFIPLLVFLYFYLTK